MFLKILSSVFVLNFLFVSFCLGFDKLEDFSMEDAPFSKGETIHYKIKWKGYNDMSWEPAENFESDEELLNDWKKTKSTDKRRRQYRNRKK